MNQSSLGLASRGGKKILFIAILLVVPTPRCHFPSRFVAKLWSSCNVGLKLAYVPITFFSRKHKSNFPPEGKVFFHCFHRRNVAVYEWKHNELLLTGIISMVIKKWTLNLRAGISGCKRWEKMSIFSFLWLLIPQWDNSESFDLHLPRKE